MSLAQGAPAGTPWLSIPRPFDPDDAVSDDDALLRFQQSSVSVSKTNPMANKTVAALKAECKTLGLRRTGSKPMLIDRLEQAHRRLERGIPIIDNEVQKTGTIDWYMLQTANGFEGSVARTMRQAIAGPLKGEVEKVFIPLLEGETTVRDNSVMPSYIFVRMRMNKNLYQVVSNMNYVINFVGADYGRRSMNGQMSGGRGFVKPMPITDEAFENIIKLTKQKRGDDKVFAAESRKFTDHEFVLGKGPIATAFKTGKDVTVVDTSVFARPFIHVAFCYPYGRLPRGEGC